MTYDDVVNHYRKRNPGWTLQDVANAVEVSRVTLGNWKDGIPRERQLSIQALTKGALKADKKIKK